MNHHKRRHGIGMIHHGAEYDREQTEFIKAMERYQKETGRRYPAFTDVLRVAKALGYRKVAQEEWPWGKEKKNAL